MRLPLIGGFIDERFLNHRLHASSLAGIISAEVALLLLGYRFYFKHVWSWDLSIVIATFLVVKISVMVWHRLKD